MTRIWVVLAVATLAAGVWWWRRDGGASPRSDVASRAVDSRDGAGGSGSGAAGAAGAPEPTRVVRPAIVAPPVPPGSGSAPGPAAIEPVAAAGADSVPFDREVRDPDWAIDQERELKLRLDRLGADLAARGAVVKVDAAECRRSLCRIELGARGSADLSAMYGALETPEGLYGWADTIVLGQVDTDGATGAVTTSVLVQFER